MLVLIAGVVLAVTALSPSAARAAHGPARPLAGTGTVTLNLLTGAATADFTGHLSPLEAETGHDDLTLTPTGASTFSYTGTRTFVAANGDKLFARSSSRSPRPARQACHRCCPRTDPLLGQISPGTGEMLNRAGLAYPKDTMTIR